MPLNRRIHTRGHNPFLLAPFLASLASDGLRATLDDYQRIALTLRCGGPWSRRRLRGVLLAVLVHDEDQEAVFRRRFEEFFDLTTPEEEAFSEVDLERALDDLHRLAGDEAPPPPPPPEPDPVITKTSRRPDRWLVWSVPAMLLLAVAVGWWIPRERSAPRPAAESPIMVDPPALIFDNQELGSESTAKVVTYTNREAMPFPIWMVRKNGVFAGDFRIVTDGCSEKTLATGTACSVTVAFVPREEGLRRALLEIVERQEVGRDSPQAPATIASTGIYSASLQGTGIPKDGGTEERYRVYPNFPTVTVEREPVAGRDAWMWPAGLAALLLLASVGYGGWLWRWRKPPVDEAPEWDPEKPRLFRSGKIGGLPAPCLDRETLDRLADSLGYFHSRQPGKRLDVPASVTATAEGGGVPGMVFERRKQVRAVLVLEDSFTEARAWNPIAGELAAGLSRRGVPVVHGRFRGVPESFRTTGGYDFHPEDLEDDRRGYLLLVFSDGKGLHPHHDTLVLENLARWPNVAWLDPRERRSWDESTALPARLGLPVYPGDRQGLLSAMERFATEQAPQGDFSGGWEEWAGLPVWAPGTGLATYVERLLGDALPWAQACAVALPPMGFGLADALRRQFFPQLPPGRIERLLALPGTAVNAAGIELSSSVREVLQAGFEVRLPAADRRRILDFLLEEIGNAKPAEEGTPEYQAWEWRRERVLLEIDPDEALERIAPLGQGPLGGSIRAEMAEVAPRVKPRTAKGWQRLAGLAPGAVPGEKANPVKRMHWAALAVLILGFVAAAGWSVRLGLAEQQAKIVIASDPGSGEYVLERKDGDRWQPVRAFERGVEALSGVSLRNHKVIPGDEYRLSLFRDGGTARQALGVVREEDLRLWIESTEDRIPCARTYPDIGLTVERCPPTGDDEVNLRSWSEALGDAASELRLMSVGIEAQAAATAVDTWTDLRGALWSTSSVDVVFRVAPTAGGQLNLQAAMVQIGETLRPWAELAQVVYWGEEPAALAAAEADGGKFGRVLALGVGSDWVPAVLDLLSPAEDAIVAEPEILAALPSARVLGDGPVLALLRPTTDTGTVLVQALVGGEPRYGVALGFTRGDELIMGSSGTGLELRKGRWQVRALSDNFEARPQTVEIVASGVHQLTLELVPVATTGTLVVRTFADGEPVVVGLALTRDDEAVEELSNLAVELPSGSWTVAIRDEGYEAASQDVEIKGGENYGISFDLLPIVSPPLTGTVLVETSPDDQVAGVQVAFIRKGEELPARTGEEVQLPAGSWEAEIKGEGYERTRRTVEVVAGSSHRIELDLVRILVADPGPVSIVATPLGDPIVGHDGDMVLAVAFSPDGKIFASGGSDNQVRVWNLDGSPVGEPFKGHTDSIYSVAFSPDGDVIASAGSDSVPRLWNLDGTLRGEPLEGHSYTVWQVAFSPTGDILATAGGDYTVRLWSLDGLQIGDPLRHDSDANTVAFSPRGDLLASADDSGTIRIWNLDGSLATEPIAGHDGIIWTVAFSPRGDLLASAGKDEKIRLWNLDGSPRGEPLLGHNVTVDNLAFSPRGDILASASWDKTIGLWDPHSQASLGFIEGHTDDVNAIAFSPQGEVLVSGSVDGTIRLWKLEYSERQ